ncbi:MAG TPA: glycosyltransferase family 1 protein [Solirubrobacterales bacterium]|nr:glycosyltransferase family 1 protein [Solirubrobacterales bacterium]
MASSPQPASGRLRVCIDARLGEGRFGGVEQVVIGIAAGLSKLTDGDEEFLFLSYPEHDEWLRPYLGGACRIVHPRRGYLSRRARAVSRGLMERLPGVGLSFAVRPSDGTVERARVDVVHFPFQDAFTTDIPSIYQPHDLQHLHLPELFSPWVRARRERVYRTHSNRAAMVVAMTSWGKRDFIANYDLAPEKVTVVPGGSVLREYPPPTDRDIGELRSRLSLPESFLLYPAQTWPHKNHLRLLEALASIRDEHGVSIPLVCPGKQTDHYRQIQEEIGSLGLEPLTRFPGFVSPLELRALYELATGLVFPSLFEGWGLPVCEAFDAGLPVASSTATGLPDVVGDAGLMFDPDDTQGMAAEVLRLWQDGGLRASLRERGRERAALFSFDRTARLFRAHYRRIGQRPLSEEDRILLAAPPPA